MRLQSRNLEVWYMGSGHVQRVELKKLTSIVPDQWGKARHAERA